MHRNRTGLHYRGFNKLCERGGRLPVSIIVDLNRRHLILFAMLNVDKASNAWCVSCWPQLHPLDTRHALDRRFSVLPNIYANDESYYMGCGSFKSFGGCQGVVLMDCAFKRR